MKRNKYIVQLEEKPLRYNYIHTHGGTVYASDLGDADKFKCPKEAQKAIDQLRARANKPFPNATILKRKPARKRYAIRLTMGKYFNSSSSLGFTAITSDAEIFSKKKHANKAIVLSRIEYPALWEQAYPSPKIIKLENETEAEWVEALPRPNPCPICKAKPTLKETKDRGMDWCAIRCPKHGNFGAWKGQSDDKALSRGAAVASWNDAISAIPNPKLCQNCKDLPEIQHNGLVDFEFYEVVAQCQTCEGCGVGQSTGEAIENWNKMVKKAKQNPSSRADNAIVQGIDILQRWGVLKWETSKLGAIVFMEKPIGLGMASSGDWNKAKRLGWEPATSSIEGEPCDVWIYKTRPIQAPEITTRPHVPTSNYQKGIKLLGNLLIKPKAIGKKGKTHFTRRLNKDTKESLEGYGFRVIPSPSPNAKLMTWVFEPPKRKIENFVVGCKALQGRSIEDTVIVDGGDIEVYLTDGMSNSGATTTILKSAGWVQMDEDNKEWRWEW